MKTIDKLNLEGKKVIIRCDFNVPIKDGKIIDNNRIKESLKTINYCLSKNAKVILLSHLGRIKEEADLAKKTLEPVATELSNLLSKDIIFINKTRGEELELAINSMNNQDIVLIQNTRYEDLDGKKESKNDEKLGKYWASLGDLFINDAFGTIHRSHASNVGISSNLESAVGFLVEKELNILEELNTPEKPYIVILGGAKVSDKIGVIKNLIEKADKILIGGGMAYTFLKAEGYETGNSLLDNESIGFCKEIIKKYPDKLVLPVDSRNGSEFSNDTKISIKDITEFEDTEMGMDLGPETVNLYKNILSTAKTVVWNGPLGVYEFDNFKISTEELLKYLVDNNIKTVLGGGDIVAAATLTNLKDKIYHASTGGGATLNFLEGKELPGLTAIK